MRNLLCCLLAVCLPLFSLAQKSVLNKQKLLADVRVLSADSLGGRLSGSDGNRMAQDYLEKRFRQIGLKPFNGSYRHYFPLKTKTPGTLKGANLLGYLPGKSEKVIVISAHYDHIGEHDGKIFNGADDNASGVGAMLAAATYFAKHKPTHTLVFAAFDAEEAGLQGANAFLENVPFPLQRILLNINLDMLSINSKGELYASGAYHTPTLKALLQQVQPRPNARLVLGHDEPQQGQNDWTNQSDHYQFHKRKIPYIYFGVEDHAHYHKATDEFANITPAFYADAAALVLDFIRIADKQAERVLQQKQE